MDDFSIFQDIVITVAKEDLDKLKIIYSFIKENKETFEKTYPALYTLNIILHQMETSLK